MGKMGEPQKDVICLPKNHAVLCEDETVATFSRDLLLQTLAAIPQTYKAERERTSALLLPLNGIEFLDFEHTLD